MLDAIDRKIINSLQGGFPLSETPFQETAERLELEERTVIERIGLMLETGSLSRFGPMYDAESMGGAFCLCAMSVPEPELETAIAAINGFDEVAHHYERTHTLNLWFVLATGTPEEVDTVAGKIESVCKHKVHLFPKLEEYFIGFKVAV